MEAALRSYLLTGSGVAALVQKIAWISRPQASALPAITLQKVTIDRGYTYSGPDSYHGEIVQLDIWAMSFGDVVKVRDAIIAVLETPGTASGVTFTMCFVNSERQGIEDVPGVGAVFRISLDAEIWWSK